MTGSHETHERLAEDQGLLTSAALPTAVAALEAALNDGEAILGAELALAKWLNGQEIKLRKALGIFAYTPDRLLLRGMGDNATHELPVDRVRSSQAHRVLAVSVSSSGLRQAPGTSIRRR